MTDYGFKLDSFVQPNLSQKLFKIENIVILLEHSNLLLH